MGLAGVGGWRAGLIESYAGLIAAIAVGGMGIAAIITARANFLGSRFTDDVEATAVAVFLTAPPAGYAIGQFSSPVIATEFGWSTTFLIFGGLTTMMIPSFLVVSRAFKGHGGGTPPTLGEFRALIRNPHRWMVAAMSFVGYSLYLFF